MTDRIRIGEKVFFKTDLSDSITGETLPSKPLSYGRSPDLEVNLSTLYERSDHDYKRFKRTKRKSSLFNKHEYKPSYYEQDIKNTSKEDFLSLDSYRKTIKPFSDFKDEKDKKIQTFNQSGNCGRFVVSVKNSLGSEGTVYYNNFEPKNFVDVDFESISKQVIEDVFKFISSDSTKIESDVNYPYYVNNYSINKLGSAVYPFDLLDEIQNSHIMLKNIKGFSANIGQQDVRGRNFLIYNFENYIENTGIEFYDDEGAPEIIIQSDKIEILKFLLEFTDGKFIARVDTDNTVRLNPISQQKNYLANEKNNISPFKEDQLNDKDIHYDNINKVNIDDDILSIVANRDNRSDFIPKKNVKYTSSGFDINYEYSHGVESIAFKGLMD